MISTNLPHGYSTRQPIKMWFQNEKDVEDGAMLQAINLANLPFIFKHVALMPDCHQGYGMPIGGVLATKDVIIPNAVGVDIGCGMCAVKTTLKEINTETLKKIMNDIRKYIPVGFNKHKDPRKPGSSNNYEEWEKIEKHMPDNYSFEYEPIYKISEEWNNAVLSLGTLGGGNHFIEIQQNTKTNNIWIMIHSGSRNLGKQVADHYNKIAKEINQKYYSMVPKEWDLAFLPTNSEEGKMYIKEMQYCVEYALANRKRIMEVVQNIFLEHIENSFDGQPGVDFDAMINIAHNYAKLENHFGHNVWIHRKGATLAQNNGIGIIPGSQGTHSYIVKGLGNPESFESCSHGAGRKMGRKVAIKTLNIKKEIKQLEDKNILHSIRGTSDLDEAPSAYKDISEVMNNQKDLVEILIELKPLAVVKG